MHHHQPYYRSKRWPQLWGAEVLENRCLLQH